MWQVEKKYEKVLLLMDRIYYDRFTPSSSRNRSMVDEKKSFLTSLDADEKGGKCSRSTVDVPQEVETHVAIHHLSKQKLEFHCS